MCRPRSSEFQRSIAAPSRRTVPAAAGQMPTSVFAREDFPAALAPNSANPVPALRPKDTCDTTFFCVPGTTDAEVLDYQAAIWPLQDDRRRHGQRRDFEDGAQAVHPLSCRDELLPVRQRDFNRCQRAAHHDRRGDHDAPGSLLHHDQVGSNPEHRRLQGEAQDLCRGTQIHMHVS